LKWEAGRGRKKRDGNTPTDRAGGGHRGGTQRAQRRTKKRGILAPQLRSE